MASPGEALTWTGLDVAHNLDTSLGILLCQYGEVVAFRLELGLHGRLYPIRVDVRVPNHLTFDRRVGREVVREFLLEAGFLRLPRALGVAA